MKYPKQNPNNKNYTEELALAIFILLPLRWMLYIHTFAYNDIYFCSAFYSLFYCWRRAAWLRRRFLSKELFQVHQIAHERLCCFNYTSITTLSSPFGNIFLCHRNRGLPPAIIPLRSDVASIILFSTHFMDFQIYAE
jgi:hypothetical protein